MNYKDYAKVIFEYYLKNDKDKFNEFFSNFIKELELKKRIGYLPKIYKEVEKLFEIHQRRSQTELILKDEKDYEKFKLEINGMADDFNLNNLKIKENKNIVGGFILRNNQKLFDASYKTALLKLFNRIKSVK